MVAMALLMVFSLVSTIAVAVAPKVEAATDSWSRMDLPSTIDYQMFPDSDIWDLTAADDGTLFALVEDTSWDGGGAAGGVDISMGGPMVWDGARWAVYPAYSDVSLMKSTDGGYTWELVWHMPASETGAPIAVVPQPGYVEGDANNDVVFIATGTRPIAWTAMPLTLAGGASTGNIYRSMDGGNLFTRVTPRNPSVTTLPIGGTITSMDVAEDMMASGTYFAVVGVSSLGLGGVGNGIGEGVYTWNEAGIPVWQDKQVVNSLPPAPFPGTMPAGNGMDVIAVIASPDHANDGKMAAVVNDIDAADPGGQPAGIYTCVWDGLDGAWGGDVDSMTNAAINVAGDYAWIASMDVKDSFSGIGDIYVGIDGSTLSNDVWRIRGLTTVTGPSTAIALGLAATGGVLISDILADDDGNLWVGCEFPIGQAQVFKGTNITVWAAWTPSVKPPTGRWPVLLADGSLIVAGGSDGIKGTATQSFTTSGVHKMVEGSKGPVYNGIGLMDDIAVSEDIPGYLNPGPSLAMGTSWCLAEAVAEEVSPTYDTDNLIYVSTFSEWDQANSAEARSYRAYLSLWRWDGSNWERVMHERTVLPSGAAPYNMFRGKNMLTNSALYTFVNDWTWFPRVSDTFSEDPYVFLLGGRGDTADAGWWDREILWYSPDKGDTWSNVAQMPIGAITPATPGAPGLSECGWWVEDNNIVFLGDVGGWVYKTTNRGSAWTEGVLTAPGLEVDSIITSPVYSDTGSSDQAILVGTFDYSGDGEAEVWLSQDGCSNKDLENVGAEIYTTPGWVLHIANGDGSSTGPLSTSNAGHTLVNFDVDWASNGIAYAAAGGYLDRWQLVGTGSTELTRIDNTDVGVYRTEVDLTDPSASTWEQLYGADDLMAMTNEDPQPAPGMSPGDDVYRGVWLSDLQIGYEGSLYVPIAVWDSSYNHGTMPPLRPAMAPSPNVPTAFGRFTLGGVARCLDGTLPVTEWNTAKDGLGHWDGLWLSSAVVGSSNILISLAWDWQEWRFKLAIYDDTLCDSVAAPEDPLAGDTGAGTMADNEVSVALNWAAISSADVYQWQIDDDCGFTAPLIDEGVTTETSVTVTALGPDVPYCWRVRAIEPVLSPWCDVQSFTTVIGAALIAPELQAPGPGATIVATKPAFQWNAIGWASNYKIQVATDATFGTASLVVDQTLGDVTAYQPATDLNTGTYYWRVKAMSADSETGWSSVGIFTIADSLPTAETEAWVWVLIVIGVVLAIVVIMLIMRTRRPV
jgi:hypothetical protein